jgi:hypothetical protein
MLVSVSVFEVCMIDSVPASSLGLERHVCSRRRAVKLVGYILTYLFAMIAYSVRLLDTPTFMISFWLLAWSTYIITQISQLARAF